MIALVRKGSDAQKVKTLASMGAEVASVHLSSVEELSSALKGAACVVSAVQGLREVIVDAQTVLLNAAVRARRTSLHPLGFLDRFQRTACRRKPKLRSAKRIT